MWPECTFAAIIIRLRLQLCSMWGCYHFLVNAIREPSPSRNNRLNNKQYRSPSADVQLENFFFVSLSFSLFFSLSSNYQHERILTAYRSIILKNPCKPRNELSFISHYRSFIISRDCYARRNGGNGAAFKFTSKRGTRVESRITKEGLTGCSYAKGLRIEEVL